MHPQKAAFAARAVTALILSPTWLGSTSAAETCQPLADAVGKLATTPTHIYASTKAGGSGAPTNTEMIYAGGLVYAKTGSSWMRTNLTTREMAGQEADKQKGGTCRYVKDEAVGGEAVAVYAEESQSREARTRIWISKSRGLPLRQEVELGEQGNRNTHMSVRYEYANVTAPAIH